MEGLGLSGATKRVAEHAREFVRLEVELATAELKKKAAALGTGLGLILGAAVLAFLALTFGLLAAAAGLATTLPVWASLLIVMGALIVITAILALVGKAMLEKGVQPVPEQAVEEARLTGEALRNGDGV
jgi:membrane protein implicated in regulation of membrane protease activity